MMRSMYSAVSGLRTHQTKMDVIGNNIANVNTVGYKKGQVTFQEVFSEVIRGAGAPQGGKGGTNPQQIGLGVNVGSINTIHTKGPVQRTDNPTDIMVDGEGFFVVTDDTNFENKYYTRAGNFSLDKDGNLVTADGYKVLGYAVDEDGEPTSTVSSIRVNRSETVAPTATNKIEFRGNLDSRAQKGEDFKADTVIKDTLGNSYIVRYNFEKGETDEGKNTTWKLTVDRVIDQSTGNYVATTNDDEETNGIENLEIEGAENDGNSLQMVFNHEGKLVSVGGKEIDDDKNKNNKILLKLEGIQFDKNKDGEDIKSGEESIKIEPSGKFRDITIFDFSDTKALRQLHQYADESDAKPHAKNGNTSGNLNGFSIDASGVVQGHFTNGERKALGQIMLAKFDNPMGLQKLGNNFFVDTRNSGEAQFGKPGNSGLGALSPGSLEMSNVDLSMEFTEMITTQRGFQANSRIITTSDEMLQELVNMKR